MLQRTGHVGLDSERPVHSGLEQAQSGVRTRSAAGTATDPAQSQAWKREPPARENPSRKEASEHGEHRPEDSGRAWQMLKIAARKGTSYTSNKWFSLLGRKNRFKRKKASKGKSTV